MSMHFNEEWAIVATIDPQDGNAVDPSTDEVDMALWHELSFILMTGVVAASGTCDFKLRGAATAGGSLTDITGKVITQLVATSDNVQTVVTLRSDEAGTSQRFVKGVMDNSAHSQLVAVLVLGKRRFGSSSDADLASVVEIIN